MSGGVVKADAQWALHGRSADGEGHRILACSKGTLSQANFAEAVSRFGLGEVDPLPQVAVSYARLDGQPGTRYLALAIDAPAAGGEHPTHDRNGAMITYTSYFCLPYQLLADEAVGYLSVYQALADVALPGRAGPPLPVALTVPAARTFVLDPLAMRVAALLLTAQPVCVLGAVGTTIDERLRFIDTVMNLLPYGLRARMTAATWARATHDNHRFRLFFSSAPRPGRPSDHVVTWGEPGKAPIPDGWPAEYLCGLEGIAGPLLRLAAETAEMAFSPAGSSVRDIFRPGSTS